MQEVGEQLISKQSITQSLTMQIPSILATLGLASSAFAGKIPSRSFLFLLICQIANSHSEGCYLKYEQHQKMRYEYEFNE